MSDESLGQLVGVVIMAVIGLFIFLSMRGKKVTLQPGEARQAEIYAETNEIKFGGFILVGSPKMGKLILTDQRLLYTNPQEQKLGFSLGPKQINSAVKGTRGPMMTLELTYTLPNGKPKRAIFVQLGAVPGVNIDPTRQLPIGMFIDKLTAWRESRLAS